MSEPTPRGEPLIAMRAPSPPEDPPDDRSRLCGMTVRPYKLLIVSPDMSAYQQRIMNKSVQQLESNSRTEVVTYLGNVCETVNDSTLLEQEIDENRILFRFPSNPTDVTHVDLLPFDIDLTLETDW